MPTEATWLLSIPAFSTSVRAIFARTSPICSMEWKSSRSQWVATMR